MTATRCTSLFLVFALWTVLAGCAEHSQRGIADKRTHFEAFVPMKQDAARDGLKPVKPFFKRANPEEILRVIERACTGNKAGSSVFDPATQAGYYVNCNPRNRQLLNGYVSANPSERPRSEP